MNRADLKHALEARLQMSGRYADQVLDLVLGELHAALARAEEVRLPGLGRFCFWRWPARRLHQQGRRLKQVPDRRVVKFIPTPKLKERIRAA